MHGVGAAYASKQRGEDAVHAVYFGDGATSSNGFHSGLNFAAVWDAPVVFVCVDNGWAISVPSSAQTAAESYAAKARAYGIPGVAVDGNDVLACYQAAQDAVERVRVGEGPSLIVLHTYRMLGHSSSDDPSKYRDDEEVAEWERLDPIDRYEAFLISKGVLKEGERETIEADLYTEIDAVIHEQEAAHRRRAARNAARRGRTTASTRPPPRRRALLVGMEHRWLLASWGTENRGAARQRVDGVRETRHSRGCEVRRRHSGAVCRRYIRPPPWRGGAPPNWLVFRGAASCRRRAAGKRQA